MKYMIFMYLHHVYNVACLSYISGHSQLIVKPTCLAYKTGLKESAMQLDSILFID